jgi:hypothetical protein
MKRKKSKTKYVTVTRRGKKYTYKRWKKSKQTRKNMSEAAKLRHKTNPPDYKKWYSQGYEKKPKSERNYHRVFTEEHKKNISIGRKLYWLSPAGIAQREKFKINCNIKRKPNTKNENSITEQAKDFISKFFVG